MALSGHGARHSNAAFHEFALGHEDMIVRRWIVGSSYVAGLIFAVCMVSGCGGESADPDTPEKRQELPEAPPFEGDSRASASLDHRADFAAFNSDDARGDGGLELPRAHRARADFVGADEPPLPDAVFNRLLAAGSELHQPRALRSRANLSHRDEPPLPGKLADARDARSPSEPRRNLSADSAAFPRDVGETARALLARSRRNAIPEETTSTADASSGPANDLAADVEIAPSVESGLPTAREPRMARRMTSLTRPGSNKHVGTRRRISSARYERAPELDARPDRFGATAVRRLAIIRSALGEPQPVTRLTIPLAEATAATLESGGMELRPVPDAVQ